MRISAVDIKMKVIAIVVGDALTSYNLWVLFGELNAIVSVL